MDRTLKKYPTTADIEEMQARGFDASVIDEQLQLARRGQVLAAIAVAAIEAFAGVTLGSGIGLLEANGLDGYANETALAAYRDRDERHDWAAISLESLNRYGNSLSFYDAEGMRFHLPAYLLADMQGQYAFDIVYNLTQSALLEEQCALLTEDQRKVVRAYLQFAEYEADHELNRGHIQRALQNYWAPKRSK